MQPTIDLYQHRSALLELYLPSKYMHNRKIQ